MTPRSPSAAGLSAPLAADPRPGEPDPEDLSARAIWAAVWRRFGARGLVRLAVSVVLSTVLPLLVYDQLRHLVGSEVTALLIASVIPVAWTLGKLAVSRRLDPVGVLAIAGFAIGLLLLVLTHGNPFALKIREPVISGALGLACLGSMLIRRPLALPLVPKARPWVPGMTRLAAANWITGIWGVVLVVDATVLIILAAVLPASIFLSVHQVMGLAFLALGMGGVIWRKRHRSTTVGSGAGTLS